MSATLQFNYTGGSTNSTPSDSLGGAHSSTELSSASMNNLFDNVQPDEATNGSTDYRAIDVTNVGDADSGSTSLYMKQTLLDSNNNSYGGASLQFGIESSPLGSTTSVSNESTAPSSVSFSAYTDPSSALSLPDIPTGSYARVWVKRVVTAGASNDTNVHGTLAVQYA